MIEERVSITYYNAHSYPVEDSRRSNERSPGVESGKLRLRMNSCVAASYVRRLCSRKTSNHGRGVHVNGGLAIMGYSDLATGYPGCRHHGIFRTYVYTWRLFALCPPFLRCAHMVDVALRKREKERE